MLHPIVNTLVNAALSLFFLCLGLSCLFYPWAPEMQAHLINFLTDSKWIIFFFGTLFLLIAFGLISNALFRQKLSYYRLKLDPLPVHVDEKVILSYLNTYWKGLFPENEVPCKIVLKKNELYIEADLPFVSDLVKSDLINRIEEELKTLFLKMIGYNHPFYLTLSFPK